MNDNVLSWEEAVLWLRKQPDQQELVRDCYYDDPLLECANRFYCSTEWQAVQKVLSQVSPGKALDIGAGRGLASYALVKDGWVVTALEPDNSRIVGSGAIKSLCESGEVDIRVFEECGEDIPFPDNTFDLLYGRAVLHHARNLESFCREITRVLKTDGVLVMTREHVISRKNDLQRFFATHALHSLYGGENAFLLRDYLKALGKAGISVEQIIAPYDSDINLFPRSKSQLLANSSHKCGISISPIIFDKIVVPILNWINRSPGRLYSFVGVKK